MLMSGRTIICLNIIYLAFFISGHGQDIKGKITDIQTGNPVAAANIFFANYQAGTYSDDSGYFHLKIPANLPLPLVISHVSYVNKFMALDSLPRDNMLEVQLNRIVRELEEVRISSDVDREWNRNIKKFTHAFLGETDNSQKCTITNSHIIDFVREKDMLKAYSNGLIIVENRAIGYKIHFLLEYFIMQGDQVSFSGKPYFESMIAESEKETNRWDKNRKFTYYGSLRHFLKTLLQGTTFTEGYEIVSGLLDHNNEFIFKGLTSPGDIIKKEKGMVYLNLKNTIQIIYTKEKDLTRTSGGMEGFKIDNDYQTSYLSSRIARIQMNENGTLYRPDLIHVYGFWAREGAADFLPFDYFPERNE